MNHESKPSLSLAHGRTLTLSPPLADSEGGVLSIVDAAGALELVIDLRAEGPIVRVRAAALQVETEGEISLGCERFELRAREGVRLVSDGDFSTSVAGDVDCRAGGLAHWEGKAVRIRARRGEAQIEAQDDVRIEGERVLLNS